MAQGLRLPGVVTVVYWAPRTDTRTHSLSTCRHDSGQPHGYLWVDRQRRCQLKLYLRVQYLNPQKVNLLNYGRII